MIWESKPWKDELLAAARFLKRCHLRRRSARRDFEIERAVFTSAYVMRKLWESGKLSSAWRKRSSKCVFYKANGRLVDRLNWHRIDEFYDLENSKNVSLSALDLCNRLVHSFVFVPDEGERRTIAGFFFASDQSRHEGLWYLQLAELLALLKETGRDYPSSAHMVRHPETNDWIVWAGHGDPPNEWTMAVENLHRLRIAAKSKNAEDD
jgi:hypothetical protein